MKLFYAIGPIVWFVRTWFSSWRLIATAWSQCPTWTWRPPSRPRAPSGSSATTTTSNGCPFLTFCWLTKTVLANYRRRAVWCLSNKNRFKHCCFATKNKKRYRGSNFFKKMDQPRPLFVYFRSFVQKNFVLQRGFNSGRQSRRRACWPLDHHQSNLSMASWREEKE